MSYMITTLEECDLLMVGSFIKRPGYKKVRRFKGKKILFISEPVDINNYLMELINKNYFDIIFGSIEENIEKSHYKYPFYILRLYEYNLFNTNIFNDTNNKITTEIDNLNNKKFCTLINRHDWYGSRTKMYLSLKSINANIVQVFYLIIVLI